MELSKAKLAEKLAKSLEKDVASLVTDLQNGIAIESELPQSNLLSECEYITLPSKTGERLMAELLHPRSANVILMVNDERFLCHKEVLSARCEYFNAMLQNQWTEGASNSITLNNTKPEAVAALLCFLYGASVQIPKFCPLLDVLQISDMFGVKDLVTVVTFHIKTEMCHSFHRPCKVCTGNAPEVIQLAAVFSLTDLFNAFMDWNVKYFCKLWPTKGFASLQSDMRQKCVKAVVDSLSLKNAIHLLKESDKLLSGITRVQWTKSVVAMGTEVMTSCCAFIAAHILQLTRNKTITELFEGLGWKTDIVERILLQVEEELHIENVCNARLAVNKLIYFAEKEEWNDEFPKMLKDLKKKIRIFLVSNYYAVIHTEPWQLVSASDKMELKSQAFDHGDTTKKLTKKPVLSSSLHKKPPTPSVLIRQPMKIKPRKTSKYEKGQKERGAPNIHHEQPVGKPSQHQCEKGPKERVAHNTEREQPLGEPPQRQAIIAIEKFLPGNWFYDIAIGPHPLLHD